MAPFHQLTATSLHGQPICMADYAGKLVLVVIPPAIVVSLHNMQASKRSTRSTPRRVWWCLVFPATSSVTRSPVEPTKSRKPVTSTTV